MQWQAARQVFARPSNFSFLFVQAANGPNGAWGIEEHSTIGGQRLLM
jgi:hypothetical protein